jgi:predicted Zn-dependent protease
MAARNSFGGLLFQLAFQSIRHDVRIRLMLQQSGFAPSMLDILKGFWHRRGRRVISRDGTVAEPHQAVPSNLSPPPVGAETDAPPQAAHLEADMAPAKPAGDYLAEARALQAAGDAHAAQALIEQALQAFPYDGDVLSAWAHLAMRQRDWALAIERSATMRARCPQHIDGYLHANAALCAAQLYDEAEALSRDTMQRFPDEAAPVIDHAKIALDRGDWPEALRRCDILRSRYPGHPFGYTAGARALQETGDAAAADAMLDQVLRSFPTDVEALLTWAEMAMRRRDWPAAIERCAIMRDRLPNQIFGYTAGAAALREAQRYAEAEAVLQATTERFPQDAAVAHDFARIAQTQRRWSEAATRWTQVQARFPDDPAGWFGAAHGAREAGRSDEESLILGAALERFPDNYAVASEYGSRAIDARDWPETVRRWQLAKSRFPAQPACDAYIALALRHMDRKDEAAAILAEALERFPGALALVIESAWQALDRRDWPAALDQWNAVRQRSPDNPESLTMAALALREMQRFDEADTLLRQATERFPTNRHAFLEFGNIALLRNDPESALARLQDGQRRFPDDEMFVDYAYRARERLLQLDPHAAENSNVRLNLSVSDSLARIAPGLSTAELQAIFLDFESLGGVHLGCKFGAVQRAFGADPLGLLRWTQTPPEALAALLEARFDGVGLPENTDLEIAPDGDYHIREKRFGIVMHTFVQSAEMPPDKMANQTARRLQYLRSKLISDLEAGEKIFVYKLQMRDPTEDEILRTHRALRGYGNGTLLYVRRADAAHPSGSIEPRAPGLMIGYLDRFTEPGQYDAAPAWGALCLKAHRLWQGSRLPMAAADAGPAAGTAVPLLQS